MKNLGWFLGVLLMASCEFPRPADVGPKDGAPDDADAPASVSTNCQLTAIEPALANTGDTLTIEGTFVDAVTVNFPGGTSAAATVLGPHRATIIVPASATAGDLTITSCGSTVGPLRFRRTSFPLGLGMFAAELDQASGAQQMTKLVTARDSHTATVVGGHVYVVGGVGSGGSLNSVEAAMINADGSLGPFEVVADVTLATARQAHTTVAIGNRLYVLGGFGSASLGSVEQATIGPDGKLGAFATVAGVALTTARQGHTSAVIGNYLYVFGGFGGSALSSIERAVINADGSLEPFVTVSGISLATARYGHSSTVVGNKLYVIGGTGGSGTLGDVEQATITADGSIGPFEAVAGVTLSTARAGHSTIALGNTLYTVGGVGASGTLISVEQLAINSNGSLGAVTPAVGVTLTTARHGHSTVVVENYVYLLGGTGNGLLTNVERATINAGGALEPLATVPGIALVAPRLGHTTTVLGHYIYVIGNGAIERAIINTDGTLSSFGLVSGLSLVVVRQGHTVAVIGNYLYVFGGSGGAATFDSIERAAINADGSLSAFMIVDGVTLATGRHTHTSAVVGGYIYMFGGFANEIATNNVERATINRDYSLGKFTSVADVSLTKPTDAHTTVVSGHYLYMIGGGDASQSAEIQRATISAAGSLGAFSIAPNTMTVGHAFHSTEIAGHYIYVIDRTSERAPINDDGSLGVFSTVAALSHPDRFWATSNVTGNYLYYIGGFGTGSSGFPEALNIVESGQLK